MDLLQARSLVVGQTSHQYLSYPQRAAQVPGTQQYPHYGYPGYHSPQYGGVTAPLHHMDKYRYSTTPAQPGLHPASGYSPAVSSYMYPQWSYPSQQYLYPGTSVPSNPHMMYNTPVHSTPKWHSQVTRGQGSRFTQDLSCSKQSSSSTPSSSRDSGIHSASSLSLEGSSVSASTCSAGSSTANDVNSSTSPDCASRRQDNTIATALSLSGISKEDLLPLSPLSFSDEDILLSLSPTAILIQTPEKPTRPIQPEVGRPATDTETETEKPAPNSEPEMTVPNLQTVTSRARTATTKTRSRCKPKFLSKEAVHIMDSWYIKNITHPYPSQEEKEDMAQRGGITVNQVNSWFNNRRNRSFNTGPKRQKRKLEEQLVSLCQNLTASNSGAAPGVIVHEISSLIQQNLQPSKRARLH